MVLMRGGCPHPTLRDVASRFQSIKTHQAVSDHGPDKNLLVCKLRPQPPGAIGRDAVDPRGHKTTRNRRFVHGPDVELQPSGVNLLYAHRVDRPPHAKINGIECGVATLTDNVANTLLSGLAIVVENPSRFVARKSPLRFR